MLNNSVRFFQSGNQKYQHFSSYFQELDKAKEQDQDKYIEKIEDFSKVIYENLESISHKEIAQALEQLFKEIKSQKKGQITLLNQLILILNDIFDAYYPPKMDEPLRVQFFEVLNQTEQLLKPSLSLLGMETLTNVAYYFCKFQLGSPDFWQQLENQILKSKDTLSIEQLSKIILALTMNNKPIQDQVWKDLLNSVLNKIEKAESKDTFYLCMALGRGKINPNAIVSDIYYTLYLNVSRHINDFDLYQLSQLAMFLCNPQASPYVPDDFWTESLEMALKEAISNYQKFEGKINKEVYIEDFLRTLVSFGIRQIGSQGFVKKVEDFMDSQVDTLDSKKSENLLFFLSNKAENVTFLQKLLNHIESSKFIESGEFTDHILVMGAANKHQLQLSNVWDQIEKSFINQYLSQINQIPKDQQAEIVAIYAFEFARADKGHDDQFWSSVKTYLHDKALNNEHLSLNALSLLSYALISKKIVEDDKIWDYLHKQVKSKLDKKTADAQDKEIEHIRGVYSSIKQKHEDGQQENPSNASIHIIAFLQALKELLQEAKEQK